MATTLTSFAKKPVVMYTAALVVLTVAAVTAVRVASRDQPDLDTTAATRPPVTCREQIESTLERITPVEQQINQAFVRAATSYDAGDLNAATSALEEIRQLWTARSPFVKAFNDTETVCDGGVCGAVADTRQELSRANIKKGNLVSQAETVLFSAQNNIAAPNAPRWADIVQQWDNTDRQITADVHRALQTVRQCQP